jgi:hypothetical protein
MPATKKPVRAESEREEPVRGVSRVCGAPGCNQKFSAWVARQRFCSGACRARAFYWEHKEATGQRYAVSRAGKRSRLQAREARAKLRARAARKRPTGSPKAARKAASGRGRTAARRRA